MAKQLSLCALLLLSKVASIEDGNWRLLYHGKDSESLTLDNAWSQFKSHYGIHKKDDPSPAGVINSSKASSELLSMRLTYFKKAYTMIAAHNKRFHSGKSKYRLALNQFADLSFSELGTYTGGEKFGKTETVKNTVDLSKMPEVSGSSSYDYRTSALDIHNQGQCGSCWAFASSGMVENRLYHSSSTKYELANQELVDCVTDCYGCQGGWSFKATEYIAEYGIASEDDYEYKARGWGKCKSSSYSRAVSAGKVSAQYSTASGESDMAKIVANGAMTVGINVLYDFYFLADEVYEPDNCSSSNQNYMGAHAIVVVGMNSNKWIIQNSWGEDWGDNGFAYFVRGQNACEIGTWDNWSWISVGSNSQGEETDDDQVEEEIEGSNEQKGLSMDGAEFRIAAAAVVASGILIGGLYAAYKCRKRGYESLKEPMDTQPTDGVPPAQAVGYNV